MNIILKPEQARFIDDQLQTGRYQTAEQVIDQALELLAECEQQVAIKEQEEVAFQPKTERGEKFWELRKKVIATQPLFKSWEEIEEELAQRRGGFRA